MLSIFGLSRDDFSHLVFKALGKGRIHAGLLYSEWYRSGSMRGANPAFDNAHVLREAIPKLVDSQLPPLVREISEGETRKFLLRLHDGLETESVLIPMESGWTLCLSSQIGCRMGCAFCETGKMGLIRHLKAEEIVVQAWIARHQLGCPVRNLVFMGMGEPLDNYDEVMKAIQIFTDPGGFGFGPSNIAVSTSGDVEQIYRFMEEADPALNLAVSINAPNDAVRNRLMPINRRHNMEALHNAMRAYCKHPRRQIFAEYVLIAGVNDALEHAEELAAYLRSLRVKINLIPYNPQSRDCFQPPSIEQVNRFASTLRKADYRVLVRSAKGQNIRAACGQLGNRALRRPKIGVGSC